MKNSLQVGNVDAIRAMTEARKRKALERKAYLESLPPEEQEKVKQQRRADLVFKVATTKAIRRQATSMVARISKDLEDMGPLATKRVKELIQSENPEIATRNAHYVIDQNIGKATQKSININQTMRIDTITD